MNTVLKYEKVVLVKELNDKFKKVGEVYEVARVSNDSFLLRDSKTRVAIGVVNFEDFERCFVTEDSFTGWTNWQLMIGFDGHNDAMYRTNRKRVQVKFLKDNVRAESFCCKSDYFNLSFGLQLAYIRCRNKALKKKMSEYDLKYAELLKEIHIELNDNNKMIKQMINQLDE